MAGTGAVQRLRLGVLIPSTNTVVEPEYHDMLPAGVTAHAGRMLVTQQDTSSDTLYRHLSEQMFAALEPTVANLMTCSPGHLALCMSAMAFVGGSKGDASLRERLEATAGVPVTTGPSSLLAALRSYGSERIVVLSPFQPEAHAKTAAYFAENDLKVVGSYTLKSPSTTSIAKVAADQIRGAIADNDSDAADAIIQVGTNLHMAKLAAAAELWLGKPVIHVNVAMAWQALRVHGIDDRIDGFGSLLAQH